MNPGTAKDFSRHTDRTGKASGGPDEGTASALDLLKEITNGTSIVVSVERNGKSARLVLDGTLITTDIERETNSAAATPPVYHAGV